MAIYFASLLSALVCCKYCGAQSQKERKERYFAEKQMIRPYELTQRQRQNFSRIWAVTGLSLIGTGIYLANTGRNPQRLDVPFFVVGITLCMESANLKHGNKK